MLTMHKCKKKKKKNSQIKSTHTADTSLQNKEELSNQNWKWGVPLVYGHSVSFCTVSGICVCVRVCINISVTEVISKLVAAAELNKAMQF